MLDTESEIEDADMEHGMVIDEQRVEEPRQSPVEVIKSSVP